MKEGTHMDKMKFETSGMTAKNVDRIADLFPNCITEMQDENGKLKRGINFEMLRQMLSLDVVDGNECYEFTWIGKKTSTVEANKPIRKTLRTCSEESKDWDTTENISADTLSIPFPSRKSKILRKQESRTASKSFRSRYASYSLHRNGGVPYGYESFAVYHGTRSY